MFRKNQSYLLVFSLLLVGLLYMSPAAIHSADNLNKLKEGNNRFVNNNPRFGNLTYEQRKKLALSQTPVATIVACSDSRVAPETILDQGPGTLFVVRLAGNTVDDFALASIEYGLSYLKTPILVVMGHENCGAVKAAFQIKNSSHNPELTALLQKIEPAVKKAIRENPGKSDKEILEIAIWENVMQTKKEIMNKIPAVNALQKEGRLQVEGAVFQINSGKVKWER